MIEHVFRDSALTVIIIS